jgi:hypothetical protein
MKVFCGLILILASAIASAGSYTTCPNGECERVIIDAQNVGGPGYSTALGAYETSNGGSSVRITTAASTQVFVGAALIKRIIVTASTAGTAATYDDADGTCNAAGALQKTGAIPLVASQVYELGIEVSAGLCVLTTGTVDISVVYLP